MDVLLTKWIKSLAFHQHLIYYRGTVRATSPVHVQIITSELNDLCLDIQYSGSPWPYLGQI